MAPAGVLAALLVAIVVGLPAWVLIGPLVRPTSFDDELGPVVRRGAASRSGPPSRSLVGSCRSAPRRRR